MAKRNKENNWETTTDRFVVFIDIMGFKDMVARGKHEDIYNLMEEISEAKKLIQTMLNEYFDLAEYRGKSIHTASFSDSIVVFSNDNSIASFEMAAGAAAYIISEGFRNSVPMKGAIAYGKISVEKDKQIFFGQPIIDSYLLQEELNYYGVVFHNSVDEYLLDNKLMNMTEFVFDIKTPFKSGLIRHTNLNWFDALKAPLSRTTVESLFVKHIAKIRCKTSGNPRKYIDNTIDVFNQMYLPK